MIRISTFLLIGFLSFSGPSRAQSSLEMLPSFSIGIGYFGETFTHPGFVLFAERSIYQSGNQRNQLLVRANLVYYKHRYHTRNWMITPEFVYRRYSRKMNFWEAATGGGWLSQRADADVFEYSADGFNTTNARWNYFAPSLAIRYGKTIGLSNDHILTPSLGGRVFWQYPFNDNWLTRYAMDVSLLYSFN